MLAVAMTNQYPLAKVDAQMMADAVKRLARTTTEQAVVVDEVVGCINYTLSPSTLGDLLSHFNLAINHGAIVVIDWKPEDECGEYVPTQRQVELNAENDAVLAVERGVDECEEAFAIAGGGIEYVVPWLANLIRQGRVYEEGRWVLA